MKKVTKITTIAQLEKIIEVSIAKGINLDQIKGGKLLLETLKELNDEAEVKMILNMFSMNIVEDYTPTIHLN